MDSALKLPRGIQNVSQRAGRPPATLPTAQLSQVKHGAVSGPRYHQKPRCGCQPIAHCAGERGLPKRPMSHSGDSSICHIARQRGIKVDDHLTSREGEYPELSGWAPGNDEGPQTWKRQAGKSMSERSNGLKT